MNKNYKQKKVFNFITLDMAGPDNKEILATISTFFYIGDLRKPL